MRKQFAEWFGLMTSASESLIYIFILPRYSNELDKHLNCMYIVVPRRTGQYDDDDQSDDAVADLQVRSTSDWLQLYRTNVPTNGLDDSVSRFVNGFSCYAS